MPIAERFVQIKVDGADIDPGSIRIGNIRLHQPIDGHHVFEAECLALESIADTSQTGGNADLDALHKKLGGKLEVKASFGALNPDRTDEMIFEGLLSGVEAHFDFEHGSSVILRGSSPTVLLDDVPRDRIAKEISASDWFNAALGERSLSASIEATAEVFEVLAQRGETDWEFATRLFGQEGIQLFYDGQSIKSQKKFSGQVASLSFRGDGETLLEFGIAAQLSAGKVEMSGWGENDKERLSVGPSGASPTQRATHPYASSAEKASERLFSTVGNSTAAFSVAGQAALENDAKALRASWYASLAQAHGRSDCMSLVPGAVIEVAGMALSQGGKFVVTEVTHVFEGGEQVYWNEFKCCPLDSFSPHREPHRGRGRDLWTATVVSVTDPESHGRVLVKLTHGTDVEVWARLASNYLGPSGGWLAFPEIGDEVIVGFTDGDHRFPVILGSVLKAATMGTAFDEVTDSLASEKNDVKVFTTRSGHKFLFSDEDGAEKIELISGNENCKIVFKADTGEPSIEIFTEGDLKVISNKTCTVEAKEDLTIKTEASTTLESTQDISIKTDGAMNLKAAGDVKIEGTNIELKSAGGSVKASPSGVDIKGPMVKLN